VGSPDDVAEKMKRTEREVLKDWFQNIFKAWEKTNDLEVGALNTVNLSSRLGSETSSW
jgi:hypothetical protein